MDRSAVHVDTEDGFEVCYVDIGHSRFIPLNRSFYGFMITGLRLDWDNAVLLAVL